MNTTLDEIIDELVKSWFKYKAATDENEKLDAWVDTVCHLDSAMAQYLYEVSDTDIPEGMMTTDFVFKELSDCNPYK